MKKIILSLALLLCLCVGAFAQTKVVFNGPIGVDWTFKRSFMHGNTLVVDFVVENNTSNDIYCIITTSCSSRRGSFELKAYDDEGNVYTSSAWNPTKNKFSGKLGGQNTLFNWEAVPKGNLIKMRMQISDIDEFATLIKTLTVPVGIGEDYSELRVSNIPIPRE